MRSKLTSLLVVAVLGLVTGSLQGCVHTDHEGQVIQPKPWSPPGGAAKFKAGGARGAPAAPPSGTPAATPDGGAGK